MVTEDPQFGRKLQQEKAAAFALRDDLKKRLLHESKIRVSRVRKTTRHIGGVTKKELDGLATSALAFGFYRALMQRFSDEHDLSPDWWRAQRRVYGRNAKDRTPDHDIIETCCPAFANYYPVSPLTDEEVFAAAKLEFYDLLAAPGTDYHDREAQNRIIRNHESSLGDLHLQRVAQRAPVDWDVAQDIDRFGRLYQFIDLTAEDRLDDLDLKLYLESEENVLGPAFTHVATLAIQEYGEGGLFWLLEWLFFPKRYSDLLRTIGLSEDELGQKEFERIKRDMVRKLPEIHARMMGLLREDPEMLRLKTLLAA